VDSFQIGTATAFLMHWLNRLISVPLSAGRRIARFALQLQMDKEAEGQ
jgi:hypothetical protein